MKKQIDANGRDCNGCLVYKTWDNYHIDKHSKTGHKACCKICDSLKVKSTVKPKKRIEPPLEGFSQVMQNFYLGQI